MDNVDKLKPKNLLFRTIIISSLFVCLFLFLRSTSFKQLASQCVSAIAKHGILISLLFLFPIALGIFMPCSFVGSLLGIIAMFIWKIVFRGDDSIESDSSDTIIIFSYWVVSTVIFGYGALMLFTAQ